MQIYIDGNYLFEFTRNSRRILKDHGFFDKKSFKIDYGALDTVLTSFSCVEKEES